MCINKWQITALPGQFIIVKRLMLKSFHQSFNRAGLVPGRAPGRYIEIVFNALGPCTYLLKIPRGLYNKLFRIWQKSGDGSDGAINYGTLYAINMTIQVMFILGERSLSYDYTESGKMSQNNMSLNHELPVVGFDHELRRLRGS